MISKNDEMETNHQLAKDDDLDGNDARSKQQEQDADSSAVSGGKRMVGVEGHVRGEVLEHGAVGNGKKLMWQNERGIA